MLRRLIRGCFKCVIPRGNSNSNRQCSSYTCEGDDRLHYDHSSGTLLEVLEQIRKRIGQEVGYRSVPKSREHLLKYHPKPEDLPDRTMKDSYTSAWLRLSTDVLVRESYVNHLGNVRLGRIVEEMDMFAVWLCHRHIEMPNLPEGVPLPYTFVTLLVDKVEFMNNRRITADADIKFSGHVAWTGSTSMDCVIYITQVQDDQTWPITKATFLMVARNATNTGPALVNKLKPGNEKEQVCWDNANQRQKERRLQQERSVFLNLPGKYEQWLMYDLFRRTTPRISMGLNVRQLPPKSRWMEESYETSNIYPFPANRNAQNTIFGGYIMRNAIELSFITASIYTDSRPTLKYVSDISFYSPVHVNSFLKFTSYVVYTTTNFLQLTTVAHIWDHHKREAQTTNSFQMTYEADKIVDEVLPRSYHETLFYMHGRRKLMTALNLLEKYPDVKTQRKGEGEDDDNANDKDGCKTA